MRSVVIAPASPACARDRRARRSLTVAQTDPFRSPRAPRTVDISADGRSVAFESLARLVPADTDDRRDIYVLDRTTGRVTLESAGARRRSEYSHPRISGDGRYLVFESRPAAAWTHRAPTSSCAIASRERSRVLTGTARNRGSVVGWSRIRTSATTAGSSRSRRRRRRWPTGPMPTARSRTSTSCRCRRRRSPARASARPASSPIAANSILPSLSGDGRWLAFASTAPLDEGRPPPGRSARRSSGRCICATPSAAVRPASPAPPTAALPNGDSSAPDSQRRRPARGVRLGRVEPPRRRSQPRRRRVPLRSRRRCADLGQPRGGRIVGGRREHRAGHLGQRPVRRVPVGCRESRCALREAPDAVPSTPSDSQPALGHVPVRFRERPDRPRQRGRARRLDGGERGSGTGRDRPGGRVLFASCGRGDRQVATTSICSSAR